MTAWRTRIVADATADTTRAYAFVRQTDEAGVDGGGEAQELTAQLPWSALWATAPDPQDFPSKFREGAGAHTHAAAVSASPAASIREAAKRFRRDTACPDGFPALLFR